MRKRVIWFRRPNTPGLWWYWLLGSGLVRTQTVFRNIGFFSPELKGRLEVANDPNSCFGIASMARLWCRSTATPQLPPKRLRDRLEAEYVKGP